MLNDVNDIKRYELKYLISEELAWQIRDYIKNICSLDKHVPPGLNGYVVNNFYFDTPDLKFYYDTKFRKLTRYKPRARFYGDQASDFIWLEIKYRNSSIIWKKRSRIPVDLWPNLFTERESNNYEPVCKNQIDAFNDLVYWYNAQPVLHVRYFREPYVTELDDYGRVTFDRRLCCRSLKGSCDLEYDESDMIYYDDPVTSKNYDSVVLLEIKVETLIPAWAIELIQMFNLTQRSYSKYCYGIDYFINYNENGRIAVLA